MIAIEHAPNDPITIFRFDALSFQLVLLLNFIPRIGAIRCEAVVSAGSPSGFHSTYRRDSLLHLFLFC
jgi:hypothetical protein